jgi:bisphosphoglycerate-dependent phosphoglycerate mutase
MPAQESRPVIQIINTDHHNIWLISTATWKITQKHYGKDTGQQ